MIVAVAKSQGMFPKEMRSLLGLKIDAVAVALGRLISANVSDDKWFAGAIRDRIFVVQRRLVEVVVVVGVDSNGRPLLAQRRTQASHRIVGSVVVAHADRFGVACR